MDAVYYRSGHATFPRSALRGRMREAGRIEWQTLGTCEASELDNTTNSECVLEELQCRDLTDEEDRSLHRIVG